MTALMALAVTLQAPHGFVGAPFELSVVQDLWDVDALELHLLNPSGRWVAVKITKSGDHLLVARIPSQTPSPYQGTWQRLGTPNMLKLRSQLQHVAICNPPSRPNMMCAQMLVQDDVFVSARQSTFAAGGGPTPCSASSLCFQQKERIEAMVRAEVDAQ